MLPKELLDTEFRFDFIKHGTLNTTIDIKIREIYLLAKFDKITMDELRLNKGEEIEISLLPGENCNKMKRIIIF